MRHGVYWRTDIRVESGESLAPLPIRRWRCREHGTVSFLPAFLAKYIRYLAEVVGTVLDAVVVARRFTFPAEVTGPAEDTARRWWRDLCLGVEVERWLLRRHPPVRERPHTAEHLPTRVIQLARSLAALMKIDPTLYARLLQTARYAA